MATVQRFSSKILRNFLTFFEISNLICNFFYRYNVHWYNVSVPTQKLILLLLQRGNKAFTLGVRGLFVGSLDCFASVRKYFISLVHLSKNSPFLTDFRIESTQFCQ